MLFIDIDRFKYVNDSLGHEMGDVFLAEIARRLEGAIRGGDTVSRFGGDEFVVLCENVNGPSEALAVAHRVHASLAAPIQLGDVPTFASASVGISLDDEATTSAEALLSDADAAMYRAKAAGRNRSELFDASMRHAIVQQLEIGSQLRKALDNGEIVMHYQAIVDPITHLATGYEALVRWNHPTKGLLGPGAFLPAAEEAGLMDLVDAFALTTVCDRIADWSARFPVARNLYITTNWSARNLARFVQQVEQALDTTGINPRQLVIEVTEGFLLEDTESSLESLQRLKALGVQIAIDDFGTGYSSLSYLTRLAVDFLKIDKSFIDKIPGDAGLGRGRGRDRRHGHPARDRVGGRGCRDRRTARRVALARIAPTPGVSLREAPTCRRHRAPARAALGGRGRRPGQRTGPRRRGPAVGRTRSLSDARVPRVLSPPTRSIRPQPSAEPQPPRSGSDGRP